jgi:uncharacterized membrane protein YqgA involved in biofilm formation
MAASLPLVKAGPIDGVILSLAALALGGVLGEWLQIDERLARLGTLLSAWSGRTDSGIEGTVAAAIPHPETDPAILLMSGIGGVLIVGLALGLLELKRIRVAALLPALALAPLLYLLVGQMLGQ